MLLMANLANRNGNEHFLRKETKFQMVHAFLLVTRLMFYSEIS